jgi:tetratricopeptide (TPR) repeat protein
MTPYYRARTLFFYGQALKQQFPVADYDGALRAWTECNKTFPYDRELHNQMGRVYFQERKFREARDEFLQVLAIDPEDLTAHYNLMLVCRGLGDAKASELHAALYRRFKNDETATQLEGPYLRSHPEDNNESLPIHEHVSAKLPRPTAPPPGIAAKPYGARRAAAPARAVRS